MVKKLAPELLFWIQVILALIFGGGQIFHMLTVSTVGVSTTFFGAWAVFTIFNLYLSFQAHSVQPSRATAQALSVYVLWILITTSNLGVLVFVGGLTWTIVDTISAATIVLGIAVIMGKREFKDPITKGLLAALFKGITHLALGAGIYLYGAEGVSLLTLVVGHITINIRLGQIWYSIREAGWDRNRRGSFLSEAISEATWIATTAVWAGALLS
jgi:hypothetical protein